MNTILNNRFTITISNLKTLERLDYVAGYLNISKSKLINMLLQNYLDDFLNKMMTPHQKDDGVKTQVGGKSDCFSSIKQLQEQLQLNRIDMAINQKMIASMYQHLILFLGLTTQLGLPEISIDLKNKFDSSLPPNFQDLKEEFLNQILENNNGMKTQVGGEE